MQIGEAHSIFKLEFDKAASFNSPNFLTDEIDYYLTEGQEEFVEQRAWGNNYKRETLESTQKRVSDLQSLTQNYQVTPLAPTVNNKPNGRFVVLPPDYRHAINEEILVSYLDCNNARLTTRVSIVSLTHDKYNKTMANPFSQPSLTKAYRLPYGRFNNQEHFEIITNPAHTQITYILRYLRNPAKINLAKRILPNQLTPFGLSNPTDEMELPDNSCREVIRIAVRNALGDLNSPQLQDSVLKTKEQE